MQALIVKLKQEVYVLRQKIIVTNGSSFDKNLTSSDAETLKDKEKERTAAKALPTDTARNIKQGAEVKTGRTSTLHTRTPTATNSSTVKKDTKTTTTTTMSNPKYKKAANTTRVGSARQDAAKLSIEAKREQVKAMLRQSGAAPKRELGVVKEEVATADKSAEPQESLEEKLSTPRKDQDRNKSADKLSDKAGATEMSPFKTPNKGLDDKGVPEVGQSFLQSSNSDHLEPSMRKSVIENPYNSFISLQSEYFEASTRVCSL